MHSGWRDSSSSSRFSSVRAFSGPNPERSAVFCFRMDEWRRYLSKCVFKRPCSTVLSASMHSGWRDSISSSRFSSVRAFSGPNPERSAVFCFRVDEWRGYSSKCVFKRPCSTALSASMHSGWRDSSSSSRLFSLFSSISPNPEKSFLPNHGWFSFSSFLNGFSMLSIFSTNSARFGHVTSKFL